MEFKIGDKVKMRNERIARDHGAWGLVGEVVDTVDDGTSSKRVTVKFPDIEPIVGMVAGQFELA